MMSLAPATRLGPYEIVALLGAGGMGEVYRARDTRLDRTVAIKILPAHLSSDPARKQRFEREAKTISNLNHPHICVLHDIGSQNGMDYLVMECMEGETLAKRLEKGAQPLEQVLKYGAQIADALDKAHRSGVVHRDLKPGNVMLTSTGAKLLDFGLAKPAAPVLTGATLTAATEPSPVTAEGTVVGTFQYMSPEQIEGKELDGRTDIFSLGAVLYEMLTGQRAFQGKSQLSVASAILEKEPAPISSIKPLTPPSLDHAIRRCLAKEPERRWQSAADLAGELQWIGESASQTGTFASRGQGKVARHWLPCSVAGLLGVTAALIAILHWGRRPPVAEPVRFELPLPPGNLSFTVSPDGRQLAFPVPGPDGRIWIRPLDSLEAHFLPGTENVQTPVFWSPDSRFIAFQTENKLKKIDVSGGPPQPICDISGIALGGAWNRHGTIIFGTVGNGIMQVPAAGGVPTLVTATSGRNEIHVFPSFLSDGRHFVYLRAPENTGVYVGSLDLKPDQQSSKRALATPVMALYAPSCEAGMGRLLFMREGSLLAQPFDERRLEPAGEPILFAEHVASFLLSGAYSASSSGVLAYRPAKTGPGLSELTWYNRQGKELSVAGEPGNTYAYFDLALSPDATIVAASRIDLSVAGSEQGIWLLDLARGVSTRFTFDPAPDLSPVWSPDGSRIAFAAARAGGTGIYQKASNGAGKERVLLRATDEAKVPNDWSRDGRFLLYSQQDRRTKADLWALPLASDGTPAGAPILFANTEFNEDQGRFSPDGHWIAYVSDESGRSEIYVQPFLAATDGGSKTQVSRDGGDQPRWRSDGKELFYLSLDGKLMAVNVAEGPTFRAGVPESLFQALVVRGRRQSLLGVLRWDVAPDGKHFLINTVKTSSEPLTVVLNWTAELKKK
jgi:eukaryotic-like serine/threonine-protein kinase